MDPIKVEFSKKGGKAVKDVFIPPEKAGLKILINIIVMLLTAGIGYYFLLPALNLRSTDFYIYVAMVLGSYIVSAVLTSGMLTRPEYVPYVKKQAIAPIAIMLVFLLILGVGYVISAPLFRAKSYSQILKITDTELSAEGSKAVDKITNINSIKDFNKIALIDKDAAEKLADKTLGDLAEFSLESQFEIANIYSTQINYKGSPYRVFPLRYGDIFKWLMQRNDGCPGYVSVNMNTQEANFISVENGIKYSPAEHFSRHLMRVVRFSYPTYLLGTPSFEIDENGNPYWIIPHLYKAVGLLGGDDVKGIIMVDACTGECFEYSMDEVKAGVGTDNVNIEWIDQVYNASLLTEQYNYYGKYSNGFINFYIGQENVKLTTQGSSYLADGSDVYLYTGVTSVTSDQSILGFAIINQRTKEAYFYSVSGATEAAAQLSANGIVSDKQWRSTFPLLINLRTSNDEYEPTYFMALKDANDVVKSYAMVNVKQYSDAVRSPNDDDADIKACLESYIRKLSSRSSNPIVINIDMSGNINSDSSSDDKIENTKTIEGVIADLRSVVVSGTTYFYIRLSDSSTYYYIAADLSNEAVLFNVGDSVVLTVAEGEADTIQAAISAALSSRVVLYTQAATE